VAVKESARSAEVRAELLKQGYKIMWDVQQDLTRASYATNGAGKAILWNTLSILSGRPGMSTGS